MAAASLWAFMASWFTPSSLFLFLNLMIGTIVLTARFGTRRSLTQQHHPYHHYDQLGPYSSPPLARAPSLLDRVKSFNFSLYKFDPPSAETEFHHPTEPVNVTQYPSPDDPPQLARAPSLLERLKSINLSSIYRSETPQPEDEDPEPTPEDHTVKRSKSDSGSDAVKTQLEKMKKSVSEKGALGICCDEDDDEIDALERRRPVTTKAEKKRSTTTTSTTKTSSTSSKNRVGEMASFWDADDGVDAKADDFINRFKQQLRLQRLDSFKRFGEMLKGK